MNSLLAPTLRHAVTHHLDYLDEVVTAGDLTTRAAAAESEIIRLTDSWRALLAVHRADHRGQCLHCRRWWRRRSCLVWTIAHHYLIDTDTSPGPTVRY